MKGDKKRILRLEDEKGPRQRTFVSWLGNPWTEAQKAEAIRRQPTTMLFWRSLLEQPEETARKMSDPKARF